MRFGSLVVLGVVLVTRIPVLIDLTVSGVVYENQGITDLYVADDGAFLSDRPRTLAGCPPFVSTPTSNRPVINHKP
jgi:hypothetical protein